MQFRKPNPVSYKPFASSFFFLLTAVLITLYFITPLILPAATALAKQGEAQQSKGQLKQHDLQQLHQRIKALKKNLQQQQSKKTQLEQDIQQAEQNVASKVQQIFSIQQQIQALKQHLNQLNKAHAQHQQNLTQQQKLLSGQLQASYSIGRQEYIKLLLNQQNPATISRIMTYYDYFNQARSEQIARVNVLLKRIAHDKEEAHRTSLALQDKHHQLKQEKLALQEKQAARNTLVSQLNQDIAAKDKQLASLKKNAKNLTLLIEKLKKALDDIPALATEKPFSKQRGKLYWPARGKVKKLFNHWRSVGKVKWQGVIINAPEGSAVHSVSHGRIAYSDWLRGYGLISIVDHGDGYMSLYGHNQALLKEVGDWVENNEIIATVGSSGGLKKAGLYFEIRHNGSPSNPTRWCKKTRR